jgi:uncharacterized protein (DUF849 family)
VHPKDDDGTDPLAAERMAAVRSWTVLPDFASVNWHEVGSEAVAAVLLERGVGVEAGLWHADAVDAWSVSTRQRSSSSPTTG